ncbi:MAG: hypothetical protein HYR60_23285 [Acidobacteria bacterium]|nr:hypothetical protein [Acidobacteriota bacterium]
MRSFLLLTLLLPLAAAGRDLSFDSAVRQVESHYNTRRAHIPFLGLAGLAVGVARPFGVKDFRLAVFEDLDRARDAKPLDLRDAGADWRPLVRVHSRRSGEATYIYVREEGQWWKMLLVTVDHSDATVLQMSLKPAQILKHVENVRFSH